MKRLTLKLFAFLLLFYLLEKPFGFFISNLVQKYQVDNRLEGIDEIKKNKELLIIGSSRAVNGIDPKIITEKLGLEAFGMAYSGSNILFHKTLVKLLYTQSNSKYLILNIDAAESFVVYERSIYRKDKLEPYLVNHEVLEEYCAHASKNYFLATLSWAYRENQNIYDVLKYLRKGKEDADITNNVDSFGFIPIHTLAEDFDPNVELEEIQFSSLKLDSSRVNAFKWILDFASENDVKVFISILPSYQYKVVGLNNFVHSFFVNDEVLIDLTNELGDKDYYYDRGHLNSKGAKSISKILAERVSNGI